MLEFEDLIGVNSKAVKRTVQSILVAGVMTNESVGSMLCTNERFRLIPARRMRVLGYTAHGFAYGVSLPVIRGLYHSLTQ